MTSTNHYAGYNRGGTFRRLQIPKNQVNPMALLGLTIKLILEVDEETAAKFRTCPPGFLMLGGEALGDENLKVSVVNEPGIEPKGINIRLVDLDEAQDEEFLKS